MLNHYLIQVLLHIQSKMNDFLSNLTYQIKLSLLICFKLNKVSKIPIFST
jgi:hypothetical protein